MTTNISFWYFIYDFIKKKCVNIDIHVHDNSIIQKESLFEIAELSSDSSIHFRILKS